jgi:hypothetical protein
MGSPVWTSRIWVKRATSSKAWPTLSLLGGIYGNYSELRPIDILPRNMHTISCLRRTMKDIYLDERHSRYQDLLDIHHEDTTYIQYIGPANLVCSYNFLSPVTAPVDNFTTCCIFFPLTHPLKAADSHDFLVQWQMLFRWGWEKSSNGDTVVGYLIYFLRYHI